MDFLTFNLISHWGTTQFHSFIGISIDHEHRLFQRQRRRGSFWRTFQTRAQLRRNVHAYYQRYAIGWWRGLTYVRRIQKGADIRITRLIKLWIHFHRMGRFYFIHAGNTWTGHGFEQNHHCQFCILWVRTMGQSMTCNGFGLLIPGMSTFWTCGKEAQEWGNSM